MDNPLKYDVIIIGGSHAGLAAGMTLGRALQKVLIIDSGKPCNQPAPHSHNFLTRDGETPARIIEIARAQVLAYPTVQYLNGAVTAASGSNNAFAVTTANGQSFGAKKLLFATGVKDLMLAIKGFAQCWGKSVIHCPFCHGYEYKGEATGILMNGDAAADNALFIRNWSPKLTLFTNGPSSLSDEKRSLLKGYSIAVVDKEVKELVHTDGQLAYLVSADGSKHELSVLYSHLPFEQHCTLPQEIGCKLSEQGYIQVDEFKKTSLPGVYAAGDNTSPMRNVAGAVVAGTMAGAILSRELILEDILK